MAAALGNQYARKAKDWENALRRALDRYENPQKGVVSGMALARIAESVVERAIEGDQRAVEEIANRLDGKPAQTQILAGDQDNPVTVKGVINLVRPG